MRRLLPILLLLSAAPAQSTTLRQQYESCVANAYLDLLVEGRPNTTLTAEAAVQACETELQALYSLLINTDMPPRQALSMVSAIRLTAKANLLPR